MKSFEGAGVVVTGAGNGIGRAIATRFATAGARVVVNDLDAGAAGATAEAIGAVAVPGDAASEAGVAALIATARDRLGAIDVFCANAGVMAGAGPETPEPVWARAWEINVMAHVRAARLLVPDWVAHGEGRFVVTASAAGLLTMLGSAPYSVTKHAALAHAEWLAATYAHRGLAVHCLCPQGVRTRLLDDAGTAADLLLRKEALDPDAVAAALWEGIAEDRFLILPHRAVRDYAVQRAGDTDGWLAAMNRLQRRLETIEA